MRPKSSSSTEESQVIALKMLGFIASDSARLEGFLKVTGVPAADIPRLAQDAQFLAGVFDFLLGDQSQLLLFAETEGINPESLMRARRLLPGAAGD